MEKKTAYLILFVYSSDDYNGIDTYLFDTKEKAIRKLQELINNEKDFYKNEYSHLYDKSFEIDTNV